MKAIAIFTLVICCIGVESLPGVRAKRETKNCRQKIYQIFHKRDDEDRKSISTWREARAACQDLGGDLAVPSTREEENKILAAINKAVEGGTLLYNWKFWIGLKQVTRKVGIYGKWKTYPQWVDPRSTYWVTGEKIDTQDTDLKLSREPTTAEWNDKGCGTIEGGGNDREGIRFMDCESEDGIQGYVCEFDYYRIPTIILEPNAK